MKSSRRQQRFVLVELGPFQRWLMRMRKSLGASKHSSDQVIVCVRGQPVFCSKAALEFCQLRPQTPLAFFGLRLPPSSGDASKYFLLQAPSSSPQCYRTLLPFRPSPDTPSEGCSKSSTSSKGNLETSLDSAPSDPKSGPTFFRNFPSRSGDRATPVASNIKG